MDTHIAEAASVRETEERSEATRDVDLLPPRDALELLAGSTRMNAATAQKLALNASSTPAMLLRGWDLGTAQRALQDELPLREVLADGDRRGRSR